MRHAIALAVSLLGLLVVARPARADAEDIVLSVPESAPPALVDALVIELQLDGCRVSLQRHVDGEAPDAFALLTRARFGGAVVVSGDASGDAHVTIVFGTRDGTFRATLDDVLAAVHPRAAAVALAEISDESRSPREASGASEPAVVVESVPAEEVGAGRVDDAPEALAPPERLDHESGSRLAGAFASSDDRAPADHGDEASPSEPWSQAGRIALELVIGSAFAGAFGGAGAAITGLSGAGWLYGFGALAPLAFAFGTWLGGSLAGGEGKIGWTLLGGLVGGLVASGLLLAGVAIDRDPTDGVDPAFNGIGGVAMAVLPPLFSVLGFELSSPAPPPLSLRRE